MLKGNVYSSGPTFSVFSYMLLFKRIVFLYIISSESFSMKETTIQKVSFLIGSGWLPLERITTGGRGFCLGWKSIR